MIKNKCKELIYTKLLGKKKFRALHLIFPTPVILIFLSLLSINQYHCHAQTKSKGIAVIDTSKNDWRKNYDFYKAVSESLICVRKNKKWGLVDKNGKSITPLKYDDIWYYTENRARVKRRNRWGCLDKNGKEVIYCKYDMIEDFINGRARVVIANQSFFIDTMGRAITQPTPADSSMTKNLDSKGQFENTWRMNYDFVGPYNEGKASVKKGNKWGFVNEEGHLIAPIVYDDAWVYNEGRARVRKGKLWGYIDENGNEVIPFIYNVAFDFLQGKAKVGDKNSLFFIDKEGHEVSETTK